MKHKPFGCGQPKGTMNLDMAGKESVMAILKLEFPDNVEGLQELNGISLSETGAIILRALLQQTVEGGLDEPDRSNN
jgi:hypothetical protein